MMKANHIAAYCALIVFLATTSHADIPQFPVVGDYDGTGQENAVDRSADFYEGNSSGAGSDKSLVIGIEQFRSRASTAFSQGNGGVVNFDNASIIGGQQTDTFAAVFGKKSLQVKSVDHLRTDYNSDICTPISGPGEDPNCGFLAKSNVDGDIIAIRSSYNFTFTEVGFGNGEHVREVGGTILGRNGSAPASKWLMKVTLDNGDILAEIAEINFQTGNSRDDTFFGAKAPSGRYITGVSWINLNGTYSGLDGFAFITNGAPKPRPKPDDDSFFGIAVGSNGGGGNGGTSGDTGDGYSSLFGSERPHYSN